MRKITILFLVLLGCLCSSCRTIPEPTKNEPLLKVGNFKHVPGPNPAITVPDPSSKSGDKFWDSRCVESSDAFYDNGTYYWYYHGSGSKGYQIGVATSRNPLGPWEKYDKNPILKSEPDTWESYYVACAFVVKQKGRYIMFYNGSKDTKEGEAIGLGIAYADHPLGPWTKSDTNPVMKYPPGKGHYLGAIMKVRDTWYMFATYFDQIVPDYGHCYLATAKSPEGPWKRRREPVILAGSEGEWDAGGFSEFEVQYYNGMFHAFYGGTKKNEEREESIGYAWSADGVHWTKYPGNPVCPISNVPNAFSFAEVHSIIEYPRIYLYHTLRYKSTPKGYNEEWFPWIEDLGIQIIEIASCNSKSRQGPQKGGPLLQDGKFKVAYETNPALYPTGGPNEWDGGVMECSDIFYDEGRYYWYYHGEPASLNWVYRIGVATSDSPTGPWERYSGNPVLLETEQESWEDYYVACADVFKEGRVYYMLYNGVTLDEESDVEEAELCSVGIATADNPLGPWTKYPGNPVAYFKPTVNKGGGYYLGGVVKVDGTYYMYMSQYNELAYDYGYMYMATASSIYGPWTMYPSNDNPEPILKPSASWDALGFSEADIFYYNGAFHMFYGGTSDEGDRPESVGYAWSNDGFNWHHFGNEPALPTSGFQNASAFAEVQSRIEYPDIYLYYTLRWKNHDIPGGWPANANDEHGCPWCEHLGVSRITITK